MNEGVTNDAAGHPDEVGYIHTSMDRYRSISGTWRSMYPYVHS